MQDWKDVKIITRSMLQCIRPKPDKEVITIIGICLMCFFVTMFAMVMSTCQAKAATEMPTSVRTEESAEQSEPIIYPCEGRSVGTAVRFRERPNTSSKIFEEMKSNSGLTVFGEENGWYYVRRNNLYGYVKAEYVMLIQH